MQFLMESLRDRINFNRDKDDKEFLKALKLYRMYVRLLAEAGLLVC